MIILATHLVVFLKLADDSVERLKTFIPAGMVFQVGELLPNKLFYMFKPQVEVEYDNFELPPPKIIAVLPIISYDFDSSDEELDL